MSESARYFGAYGLHGVLASFRRFDGSSRSAEGTLTQSRSVEAPTPTREATASCERLKLLSRELAEHMGDIGCSIALRETPISHLRVGRAAVIELDHDTGVFLFRESDAEDGIVLATTDQHLLVDVIVGRFFKRSEGLSPQVRDGAVRALVGRSIDEVERDLILHTLRHCNGNRTHTAYMLDVSVRTLRNKLRGYLGGLTGSGDTG